jgi:hypothetical protein
MTIPKYTNCKTQNRADWHCHILPNLDDGAKDLADSLAIAEILAKAGFSEVHCTPHSISGAYEASPVRIRQATRKLQEAIDGAGIPLQSIMVFTALPPPPPIPITLIFALWSILSSNSNICYPLFVKNHAKLPSKEIRKTLQATLSSCV